MKNAYLKWTGRLVVLTWVVAGPLQAENIPDRSSETLFNEALVKETGERDLEQALVLFRQVASTSKNPSLSAKAQLRTGFILERLNKPSDAVQAYQNVMTLPAAVPAEVMQAAQSNLDRLQGRLERERMTVLATPPQTTPLPPAQAAKQWMISTDYGMTSVSSAVNGFPDGQFAFWTSLSRQFNSWGSWGLSVGYFGSKKDDALASERYDVGDDYTYSEQNRNFRNSKSLYLGTDLHSALTRKRWSLAMSAGMGMNIAWVDQRTAITYEFTGIYEQAPVTYFPDLGRTQVYVRPAIPLSLSAEWRMTRHISIGGGVRDLIVFDADNRNTERSGSVIVRHVVMPFGRVAVRF